MNNFIRIALNVALLGQHPEHLVGAILVKGGSIIQRQANHCRNRGVKRDGMHAEERAITKAGIENCKDMTIVVARRNKLGKVATMSRPCPRCMRLIQRAQIKKIVYNNWNGEIVMERV